MSISLAVNSAKKFAFVHHSDPSGAPVKQLDTSALEKPRRSRLSLATSAEDFTKSAVVFDDSTTGVNLELNKATDPFVAGMTPSDSTTSVSRSATLPAATRPTLYHSAGMWARSKKRRCRKRADTKALFYQHFLNIKKISDHQLELLLSVLARARRQGRVDDAITLSLFLYESSGLRAAIDADVELFRKWHEGDFKKSLRARWSSERMLFKGYVDELTETWRPLSSEELFELPVIKMLSRTPAEILAQPPQNTGKSINQRTYFNTLVYGSDNKDRGHTYY